MAKKNPEPEAAAQEPLLSAEGREERAKREEAVRVEVARSMAHHDSRMERAGASLKKIAGVRGIRQHIGLNSSEVKQAVIMLAAGSSWPEVKRSLLLTCAEESVEAWKPELLRMAEHPEGERRMPHAAAPKEG